MVLNNDISKVEVGGQSCGKYGFSISVLDMLCLRYRGGCTEFANL